MSVIREGPPGRSPVAGDWLEVAGVPGRSGRRGQLVEVLGRPGHEHYRVRWDEEHESLFVPTKAWRVVHPGRPGHRPE